MNQSTSIPQQLIDLRERLEDMFRRLSLIHDITVVCRAASESVNSDTDAEVSHVLRRCGSGELYSQMKVLTSIIEQLGGRTDLSDDDDEQEIDLEVHSEE